MSWNGSGTFSIQYSGNPVSSGTTISSTWANGTLNEIAVGITNCVAKDGQNAATADLPMGNNKHTNVADATARNQYASYGQLQDSGAQYLTSVSGTNTITANLTGLAAYAAGQAFRFVAAAETTGAVTLNINSLGAKAITKQGTTALVAGDIPANQVTEVIYDGTRFQIQTLPCVPRLRGLNPTGAGTPTPVEGLTDSNTAVGLDALVANVDGYENTACGVNALKSNTSGTENNAFGTKALEANTTGAENVAIGVRALHLNEDGNDNTAVGHAALNVCTSGDDNTAIGQTALYRLTTGSRNTAVGRQALENVLTGTDNTAVGHSALDQCTGSTNTAVGQSAGYATTSGSGNTYLGYSSASSNQTGNFNCVVGYQAMNVATAASSCVYMGYQAGYVSTGDNNTGVGNQSMLANTDGVSNTALGILSLSANTSGDGNVGIGNLALSSNTTGDHNTAVGMSSFTSGTNYSNSTCLGYNAQVTGSNQVQLGDSSTTTYAYGAVQNRSDARDKADVRDTVLGLEFIQRLRPVDFRWAYREEGGIKRNRYHHGFIAQEVEQIGAYFGGLQHHAKTGGQDVYTIGYDELIAPLVKAVQQLAQEVAALKGGA